ncbi:hypothetical protein FNJ84_12695 [Paracoccus sp. M683]|uniref:hypothetical protein n=1 Tax=Paracoccus sp. M683 TaxID=2594268 RepID=UPI00117E5038|nr:hypothetical protein [Paracoccus sp. M683]TRW96908.1 hypothetical protein FNJ84_12695 [Paracoccus sp. M683]
MGGVALPFLLTPEAQNRRPLPADYGSAGFRHFLSLAMAGAMLTFAFLFRMPEGLVKALEQPFLVDQGFALSQIRLISGAGRPHLSGCSAPRLPSTVSACDHSSSC